MKHHYRKYYLNYSIAVALLLCLRCNSAQVEPQQTPVVQQPAPNPTPNVQLSPVEQHGQLRVEGNRIVNEAGEPVQLRGMSYFWSQWQGQYYTPQTVKWLKEDWRSTVVRAAMGIEMGGYLDNPEAEKQKVITLVDAAISENMYVIIDWHDHHAEQHTAEAVAFFSEMARRYGSQPNVIYEIYNEPLDVSWSGVIKPYAETVINAIRQHDPDNIIVCGTRKWSQEVAEAADDPIQDENVAYTLHFYAATHKQQLRDVAQKALDKGAALMVTEFGTCEASGDGYLDEASTRAWWAFLDKNKISWCNWSVADKGETASALQPNASVTGGWPATSISRSGQLIRQELQKHNPGE